MEFSPIFMNPKSNADGIHTFEGSNGDLISLMSHDGSYLTERDLQNGWEIKQVLNFGRGLLAFLINGEARAIWTFGPTGLFQSSEFDAASELLKLSAKSTVRAALTLGDIGKKDVGIQELWSHGSRLDSKDLDIIIRCLSTDFELHEVNHPQDLMVERVIGAVIPVGTQPGESTVASIGNTQIFYDGVERGHLEIVAPDSGRTIRSSKSLFLENNSIVYPFFDGDVFHGYLFATGSSILVPTGYLDLGNNKFYVSNRDVWKGEALLSLLRGLRYIIDNYKEVSAYVLSGLGGRPAPLVFISHIGHHIWNELSGLERSFLQCGLSSVKNIYSLWPDRGEHCGPIDELFGLNEVNVERIREGGVFPQILYQRNEWLVRLGEGHIPSSLTHRIKEYSYRICRNLAVIRGALSKADISILISTRFENRSWDNQLEEVVDMVDGLLLQNVSICLIFDGHNSSNDSKGVFQSHEERSAEETVSKEREFCRQIKERFLDTVEIIDNIGGPVCDSIVLAAECDFFVVPWGAGLAKYKWASTGFGIIASNSYCLDSKGDRFIYQDQFYVEGASSDIWFDSNDVTDQVVYQPGMAASTLDRGNFSTRERSLSKYVDIAVNKSSELGRSSRV